MSVLDQLLYTWAARGPQGHSGFQPIAATGPLADSRTTLTKAALRLCRYEAPRGGRELDRLPVSYGWLDHGEYRLVFRRRYLGTDALGRPGNFAAHIVAGPRADLPAAAIARRMTSPFWWDGEDADGYAARRRTLEPVPLTSIPPAALQAADAGLLGGLTDTLLRPRLKLPLVLRCPSEQIAALIAELADRLPGCLDTVPFSTYEQPAAAAGFHLVGMAGAERPANATPVAGLADGRSRPASPARDLILSDDPGDRSLVLMSVQASGDNGAPASVARIGPMISLFDQLRQGRRVDRELVVLALRRPSSADTLIQMSAAREVIATDLAAGRADVLSALRESAPALAAPYLEALGTATGSRTEPVRVVPVMMTIDELPGPFADACGIAIVRRITGMRDDLRQRLDAATALRLLRYGATCGLSQADLGIAMLLDIPAAYPAAASATDLPAAWRGVVFAAALARMPSAGARVAGWLRGDARLAHALAAARPVSGELIKVLKLLSPPAAEDCVLAALTALPPEQRYELTAWCAARLAAEQQLAFLLRITSLIPAAGYGQPWDAMAIAALTGWLSTSLDAPAVDPLPSPAVSRLLRGLASDRTARWSALVDHLSAVRPGTATAWIDQGVAIIDWIAEPEERRIALDLMLLVLLHGHISETTFAYLARRSAQSLPGGASEAGERLLTAAYRGALRHGDLAASALCLAHLASLIDQCGWRDQKTRRFRHRSEQEMAAHLAQRLPDAHWTQVAARISASSRTTAPARWWDSINPPAAALPRS